MYDIIKLIALFSFFSISALTIKIEKMNQLKITRTLAFVSFFIITLGLIVLLGWMFNIQLLKTVLPGYVSMKINTAICFVLVGSIFAALVNGKWNIYCKLISFFLILFGIASLSQNIFNWDLGIDQLIMADDDPLNNYYSSPGRPSQTSALCFSLIGFAFTGINSINNNLKLIAQYCLHVVTLFSFIAIVGYLFNVPAFYKLSFFASMAIHTSFAFFVLSIGVSFIQQEIGLIGLFTGEKSGNVMARKLFPKILISILVLGFISLIAHRNNLISGEFGTALFATSFILVSLYLIWSTAHLLNKIDLKKHEAEQAVFLLNENLEKMVAKRTFELALLNIDLEASKEHFRKIFSLNSAGIAINSLEGNREFIDVNDSFTKLLDYKREDVIGKNTSEIKIMTEEERLRLSSLLTKQHFINNEEIVVLTKSGELINVLFSVDFFETGKKKYYLTTFIDITERKKTEEKIKILSEYLTKENKQLEDFAHIVSHNLRGPTGSLKILLQFYKEEKVAEQKEILMGMLEKTVINIGNTLNELLEVITIKHDSKKEKEKLFFETVFQKIKQTFDGQIIETNATVTSDFSKAPEIEYSSIYLESIMQNLLSNALKYRSNDRSPVIHFETNYINGMLQLTASDNGLGIDLALYGDRLFGFHKTFHEHPEAKGVGLFITKVQVESLGGEITVVSEVNKGTIFTVIFDKKPSNLIIASPHHI